MEVSDAWHEIFHSIVCDCDTLINYSGALCRAALDRGNPTVTAVAQSLGLKGEVEIQRLTDFLKRFGCKYYHIERRIANCDIPMNSLTVLCQ